MNKCTVFFLILLRLAIGWHFLAEGYHKLEGYWHGPTETVVGKSKPFSSAGYFREGTGPLAKIIRKEVGDPDDEALGLLEAAAGESASAPLHTRTPPLLAQEWSDFVRRFGDYYNLDDEQRKKANDALTKAEDDVVGWLTRTTVDAKNFKAKTQEGQLPVPTRLALYKRQLENWSADKHSRLFSMGSDAESIRQRDAKAEVVRLRVGLLNDLDEYTQELRKDLEKIPTAEQKAEVGKKEAQGQAVPPQPQSPGNQMQRWIDLSTMYGLTILGACLVAGLFSRTACVLSAGFLLMTYLCIPPFPWLPTAPNNEGYYLFVNKNLIEMLALLALATTASGRWFGLDALIHAVLFGGRRPSA